MKELLELFNWSAVARHYKVSHSAVLKAVKEKGRAGLGYVQYLRDVIAPELVRDYEKEVRDKIESKKEKK